MKKITSISDMEAIYRRRVPKLFREYVTEGSWSGQTARDNLNDLSAMRLRQRVGISIAERSTSAQILGQDCSMPVAIAPVGFLGMQRANGEILTARAAEAIGVPFTLSTMSICSMEEVAAATQKPFWFQLYVMRDKEFVSNLLERARKIGCTALVITADMQIGSVRHNEIKNGLSDWPRLSVASILNAMTKIRWGTEMIGAGNWSLGNIVGHAKGVNSLSDMNDFVGKNYDPSLTWDDVSRLSEEWGGKVIVKGVMDPRDAELAREAGADAIIVSNHGGRQLDGAISSIRALERIAEAVGDRVELHMDGGIRSGQDVLKAISIGAKCVYLGRAIAYALGSFGELGVKHALGIIQRELEISMALCGRRSISEIERDVIDHP